MKQVLLQDRATFKASLGSRPTICDQFLYLIGCSRQLAHVDTERGDMSEERCYAA